MVKTELVYCPTWTQSSPGNAAADGLEGRDGGREGRMRREAVGFKFKQKIKHRQDHPGREVGSNISQMLLTKNGLVDISLSYLGYPV